MNDTDMKNATNDSDQDMSGAASAQTTHEAISNMSAPTSKSTKLKKHNPTGYTWSRDEDAPTYGWRNKKAQDEYARAAETIVDIDKIIGKQFGDVGMKRFAGKPAQ